MPFVADERLGFSLQGLRWISKSETNWTKDNKTAYEIEIAYKGQTKTKSYKTKKERDKIYDLALHYIKAKTN